MSISNDTLFMQNQFLKLIFLFILSISCLSLQGQRNYSVFDASLGIRMTNGYGISGKFGMPYDGHYIELISYFAGYEDKSIVNVTALYELTVPLTQTMNFYYGLGPGINILTNLEDVPVQFALNGIVGVDYTFPNAPFNFSFDYLPNYSFDKVENTFYNNGFGLTARYIFN